ncbi:MAG: Rne/Rng family ribonuclease [Bacteroidetes bacterium]|nr:Rne/Rng family ribonuclease [Bacteroidota bacterium]
MKKEILINSVGNEIRIAITEESRLAELFVETPEKERMVGDIYFGKVAKVMPGIQAAFIDIGLPQDAFLHFSDISDVQDEYNAILDDEEDEDDEEEHQENGGAPAPKKPRPEKKPREEQRRKPVTLQKGQEIIVQITKEPVAKKGVRVTSQVSLPGRFLVLLPFDGKVGISKKISSFRERRRLRRLVRSILPAGFGVIVRTNAENQDEKLFLNDLESLLASWREIEKSAKEEQPPSLIYKDMATTSSVIRDLFSEQVERVVTDDKKLFKEIKSYVKVFSPEMADRVEYYGKREPIFDSFGIEKEIQTLLVRKVWLKHGGYIIIEQTEAMTVVDVNSGRYAASKEQEENSLKTNLEAAREVSRQIRLRDLGGIIVIDFIDMLDDRNKKKVYDEMKKEFKRDRSKHTILPLTDFCLMQITRQRQRQSIIHSFTEPCPVCGGTGMIQSKTTILSHIERWLRRYRSEGKELRLHLRVNPSMAEYITNGFFNRLWQMRLNSLKWITIEEDKTLQIDDFRFVSVKQDKDITPEFLN